MPAAETSPSALTYAGQRLMAGLPTKEATNRLAGWRYSSRGGATCSTTPARSTATRLPMVMASPWSWVT